MCSDATPSPGEFRRNYDVPLPWYKKIYLTAKNTGIKIVKRQTCCGNHGEPGC